MQWPFSSFSMTFQQLGLIPWLSTLSLHNRPESVLQVLLLLSVFREFLFFIRSWPSDCFLLASDFFFIFFFLCSLMRLWFIKVFVFARLSVSGICCWSFFFILIFDAFCSVSLDSASECAVLASFADCNMLLRFKASIHLTWHKISSSLRK